MKTNKRRLAASKSTFSSIASIFFLSFLCVLHPGRAHSQATSNFLVQMVCVNGSNQPIYGDPYNCPSSRRKLSVGEALPYHKLDFSKDQISDSFPIADLAGTSKAIQSYYYPKGHQSGTGLWGTDNIFFQYDGGYNIIGTDGNDIFFRGTWDGSGGWQPWWTFACQAKGWVLFPNTQYSSFSYGSKPSPTANYPKCATFSSSSAVEYNKTNLTYAGGKTLPTIYDFHFANSTDYAHDSFEANYFTELYGVTRWEAWSTANSDTTFAQLRCPNSAGYSATVHGYTYYMNDCRDWAQITTAPPTPWNPNGTADTDPHVLTWPIDPLFNSVNILQNSHMGGTAKNSGACDLSNWSRGATTPITNWAWDTSAVTPMQGAASYNCALQFSVPGTPNGNVVFQQQAISAGQTGTYTYGVQLWSPNVASSSVYINVIGRDASGAVTINSGFIANTQDKPLTFAGSFNLTPATTTLFFAMYPQVGNVGFDFSGAWIARAP